MLGKLNRTIAASVAICITLLAYQLSAAQLEGMEAPTDVTGADCRMCHTDFALNFQYPHPPALNAECTACHLTTGETGHGGLVAEGRDLCLTCHEDKKDHNPAATCFSAGCHSDIHGSDKDEDFIASRSEEYPGFFEATAGASFVGSSVCLACHGDKCEWWSQSIHSAGDYDDHKSPDLQGCESCHGPGGNHYGRLAGIGRFEEAYTDEIDQVCLKCHRDEMYVPDYEDSTHKKAHITCTDCHTPHDLTNKANLKAAPNEVCFSCHKTKRADFKRLSTHIVDTTDARTGMFCYDCHNPHGSANRAMLNKPLEELCIGCHVDKAGPFVYPHAGTDPTLGRGCTTCHTHHGSSSPNLLLINGRGTCLQCHTEMATNHGGGGLCWSCHGQHHGSNTNYFFLD